MYLANFLFMSDIISARDDQNRLLVTIENIYKQKIRRYFSYPINSSQRRYEDLQVL
jgi:hypothetical protein